MKNLPIIIFFLLLPFISMAQKEISLSVNDASTGHSISLKYGIYLSGKNQIDFGIKYHINPRRDETFNNIRTPRNWQHLGLDAGFYRDISQERFKTRIRLMYNIQYTYASIKRIRNLYNPEFDVLSPPIHFIENSFGLNLKAPITDKVFAHISAAAGVVVCRDENAFFSPKTYLNFSRLLSFGLVYRIK